MEETPVTTLPDGTLEATYKCLECGRETIWRQRGQGFWFCTLCETRDDSDEDLEDEVDEETDCPALEEALEFLLLDGRQGARPMSLKEMRSGLIYEGLETGDGEGDRDQRTITGCRLLAGAGTDIAVGAYCALLFARQAVFVVTAEADWAEGFTYDDVRDLELGGPGAVQTGGGFVGGGFGVGGAITGMLAAQALNGLTRRTKIHTLIRLATRESEYIFSHDSATPKELRLALSPAFVRIAVVAKAGPAAVDIATQLTQLAALRTAGHLTDAEFETAKAKVLGSRR